MSEEQGTSKTIQLFEAPRFTKTLSKLREDVLEIVEDEIERIAADPEIGERKKGDLSHIRVHKFWVEKQQLLLAYMLDEENRLTLYLLDVGSHENFYKAMSKAAKRDKKDFRVL